MKRKNITLLLSVALVFCFFMPLFQWHSFEMNGMNYILSTHIPDYKYFLLLIPFSALILFFGALNNENYLLNRNLMSVVPIAVSIFIFIMRWLTSEPASASNLFSEIDPGFWLIPGTSILLVLTKGKKRIPEYY